MATDPNSPAVLKSVPNEHEAAAIVAALAERGVEAKANGIFLAGFRAEAPSQVDIVVKSKDLDSAKLALAEIELDQETVDWSKVDVGDPE